jgi:hypothetical protein
MTIGGAFAQPPDDAFSNNDFQDVKDHSVQEGAQT